MGNGNNNFIHFGYCYKLCISFPVALCIVELWYTMTTPHPQRCFPVMITTCDDCPYKEYGLRKCEEADRWFGDGEYFEPENEIAPWCPKCASHSTASSNDVRYSAIINHNFPEYKAPVKVVVFHDDTCQNNVMHLAINDRVVGALSLEQLRQQQSVEEMRR